MYALPISHTNFNTNINNNEEMKKSTKSTKS